MWRFLASAFKVLGWAGRPAISVCGKHRTRPPEQDDLLARVWVGQSICAQVVKLTALIDWVLRSRMVVLSRRRPDGQPFRQD
jgi:hypothetical protein